MSEVDASVLRAAFVLEYTFRVLSEFRQVACAIDGVTRGAWFASRCIGDDEAAEQSLVMVVDVVDLRP